jgi:hypothetical protein
MAPFRWMNRRERDWSLGHRRLAQRLVGDGLIMQKSVVEVCRPAYTRNPIHRQPTQSIRRRSSPALRLIRARTR